MRRFRWMAGLLGASVVLNLVLGWLVLATPTPREHRGRGFDRMVARIEASLPEADRPVFRGVLDRERKATPAPWRRCAPPAPKSMRR
ncbi:hypothetical protein ACFQU2_06065 [Siccirubricoccus deserti]